MRGPVGLGKEMRSRISLALSLNKQITTMKTLDFDHCSLHIHADTSIALPSVNMLCVKTGKGRFSREHQGRSSDTDT